jgi:hypothetical protein
VNSSVKGSTPDPYSEVALRQESKLLPLLGRDGQLAIPKELTRKESNLGWFNGKYRGNAVRILRYVGAAGEDNEVVESKLKEMTDPYRPETRNDFTLAAYSDPTLAPSLENRNNALFENGFTLEFELKSTLGMDGMPLPPDGQEMLLNAHKATYGKYLQIITDWAMSRDINLLEKMKASHIGCVVQGRSLTLITPPLSLLPPASMPFSLTTMSTEEVLAPIIDTSRRKLVAIRLDTKSKKLALNDEMIYCIRKHWGLRTDSMFYGASTIEPVLQTSKAYKRLVNFDGTKSVVASYLTKLLLKLQTVGDNTTQEAQLNQIIQGLVDDGTDVIGIKGDVDITPVQPKVDTAMMEFWSKKFEELLMSAGGSTSSQLGRTSGLNRDTATIQEIVHQKYIRTPDEEMISSFYENQLLNPLLVHLAGGMTDQEGNQNIELPVRIVIKRITKVDEKAEAAQPGDEATRFTDTRVETQSQDLAANRIKQQDVETATVGASYMKSLGSGVSPI